MASEGFDHLLSLISDKIRKSSMNFRDTIPAYDRLAVTKIFDNYESLVYFTKISKSTICNVTSFSLLLQHYIPVDLQFPAKNLVCELYVYSVQKSDPTDI